MSGRPTAVTGDQKMARSNLVDVGKVITNVYHAEREKLRVFESCVAFGALLNAKERHPAPKCHPDTRQAVQAAVKNWIRRRGDDAEKDIMWVSGVPGAGKSAVVQTVCETLCAGDGSTSWLSRIAANRDIDACFFFARGCGDQETAASFPATIAYQLARSRLSFSYSVKRAILAKPSIFEESWPSQFRHLVLEPAKRHLSFLGPVTIVIDGLDECDSDADQVEILKLVVEATATKRMRFLIACQPNQAINIFFSQMHVSPHTYHIRLDEKTFNTRRDIEVFLHDKFASLRRMRPEEYARLPNGEDWPGSAVIRRLADDSDPQFMFPALAVEFIDLPGLSPNEQLRIVLATPPDGFSKLDALYGAILSSRTSTELRRDDDNPVECRAVILRILQVLIAWPSGPFSPARIAELLGEKVDVVQSIIHGPLRLLFKCASANPRAPITLCHQSLRDYLLDSKRSGVFFISCGDADSLFSKILSYPPPTTPLLSYFPGAVVDVLTALLVKGDRSTVADIAASLYLDPSLVERVIYGPARSLFDVVTEGVWLSTPKLQSFLMDTVRAGDFSVPRTDPDALLIRIATRQFLSDAPYSQDVWMGILTVVVAWPFSSLTIAGVASVLDIASKLVEAAVLGPTKSLFKIERDGKVCFSTRDSELRKFLSDRERAGRFYIPTDKHDTIVTGILSRQPPSDSLHPYSRDVLMGVLTVVRTWGAKLTVRQIASVLGLDSNAVADVISATRHTLFDTVDDRIDFKSAFGYFLFDRERARDFYIPMNQRDTLFTGILSRQPPSGSSQASSRDVLTGILTVVKAWGAALSVLRIAAVLDANPIVIDNIVNGATHALFNDVGGAISFSTPELTKFLSDPERAGDFYIAMNKGDTLYTDVLSRRPPHPYSRDVLMGVLVTVDLLGNLLSAERIADVLDVDPSLVTEIVASESGPTRTLFDLDDDGRVFFSTPQLRDHFFRDPTRAGEFAISNDTLDPFFIRILSRHPNFPHPSHPSSRQTFLDVLAVLTSEVVASPFSHVKVTEIASILNVEPRVVKEIISGPASLLFRSLYSGEVFLIDNLKAFLQDVDRAGEFYIPDEGKTQLEVRGGHYGSIYEKIRRIKDKADTDS